MKKVSNAWQIIETTDKLRIIGIFLIVSCHCCHLSSRMDYCQYSQWMSAFIRSIGTLGVVVFFFVSGYFFAGTKHSLIEFWKRKVSSIIIPWLFTAIVIYLYEVVRKGGFSFLSLGKEIIGFTSYTWYLSVLCILYFLMWPVRNKARICVYIGILCLCFTCLYNSGILGVSLPTVGNVLPLNWGGVFLRWNGGI